jgi:hypothetical protein
MRNGLKRAVLSVALVGWVHLAGSGQVTGGHGQQQPTIPQTPVVGPVAAPNNDPTSEIQNRQAKLRNDERQKRLVADSDKLLELATSLHDDVSKTNKNVLSLDVIKRADEIERLAHAVKERMRSN